jgi:uncharacterized protein (TIRG00374 family)
MSKHNLVGIIVSSLLVILSVHHLGFSKIIDAFILIPPWILLAGALIIQIVFICTAFRWIRLIEGVPSDHFGYYLKSLFFNFFTPSALGSDGFRLAVLKSKQYQYKVILKALLRERLIGLYGSILLMFISALLVRRYIDSGSGLVVLNTVTIATCSAIMLIALGLYIIDQSTFNRLKSGGVILRHKQSKTIEVLNYCAKIARLMSFEGDLVLQMLTLAGNVCWAFSVYMFCSSLDQDVSLPLILYATLLTELSRLIPLSSQGLGIREVVFAYVLSGFGCNPAQMFAAGAVSYMMLGVMQCLNWPMGAIVNKCYSRNSNERAIQGN